MMQSWSIFVLLLESIQTQSTWPQSIQSSKLSSDLASFLTETFLLTFPNLIFFETWTVSTYSWLRLLLTKIICYICTWFLALNVNFLTGWCHVEPAFRVVTLKTVFFAGVFYCWAWLDSAFLSSFGRSTLNCFFGLSCPPTRNGEPTPVGGWDAPTSVKIRRSLMRMRCEAKRQLKLIKMLKRQPVFY